MFDELDPFGVIEEVNEITLEYFTCHGCLVETVDLASIEIEPEKWLKLCKECEIRITGEDRYADCPF